MANIQYSNLCEYLIPSVEHPYKSVCKYHWKTLEEIRQEQREDYLDRYAAVEMSPYARAIKDCPKSECSCLSFKVEEEPKNEHLE